MALKGLSSSQGKMQGCEARPTSCLGGGPALSARRIVVARFQEDPEGPAGMRGAREGCRRGWGGRLLTAFLPQLPSAYVDRPGSSRRRPQGQSPFPTQDGRKRGGRKPEARGVGSRAAAKEEDIRKGRFPGLAGLPARLGRLRPQPRARTLPRLPPGAQGSRRGGRRQRGGPAAGTRSCRARGVLVGSTGRAAGGAGSSSRGPHASRRDSRDDSLRRSQQFLESASSVPHHDTPDTPGGGLLWAALWFLKMAWRAWAGWGIPS